MFFNNRGGDLEEEELVLRMREVDTGSIEEGVGDIVGASGIFTGNQLVLSYHPLVIGRQFH